MTNVDKCIQLCTMGSINDNKQSYMAKSIAFSVRFSNEDAEYIAGLDIDGAVTPSEKIRAIVEHFKSQHQDKTYKNQLRYFQSQFTSLVEEFKEQELSQDTFSEAVPVIMEWLIEFNSYLTSVHDQTPLDIVNVEQCMINRLFRLFEHTLRLAITTEAPCYTPNLIRSKVHTLAELINLIK